VNGAVVSFIVHSSPLMYSAEYFSGCIYPTKLYPPRIKRQRAHHGPQEFVVQEKVVLVVHTALPAATVMIIGRKRVVPLASSGRSLLAWAEVLQGISTRKVHC
jgi:hypothetical protein